MLTGTLDVNLLASRFDVQSFLDLLNGELSGDRWVTFWGLAGEKMAPSTIAAYKQAAAELRRIVDDWFNSGRRADGSEAPRQRSEDQAPSVRGAVDAYFRLCRVQRSDTGTTHLHGVTFIPTWSRYRGRVAHTIAARHRGREIIMAFVYSKASFTTAKCRKPDCGRYFRLNSNLRKQTYAHGLFCTVAHNRAVAAVTRTSKVRGENRDMMLQWLREELGKRGRKPSECDGDVRLKRELAKAVRRRMAAGPPQIRRRKITAKWVSQNLAKIPVLRVATGSSRTRDTGLFR